MQIIEYRESSIEYHVFTATPLPALTRDRSSDAGSEKNGIMIYLIKIINPENLKIIKQGGLIQVWICGANESNIPFPHTILTFNYSALKNSMFRVINSSSKTKVWFLTIYPAD
jgi:hypothetical protein